MFTLAIASLSLAVIPAPQDGCGSRKAACVQPAKASWNGPGSKDIVETAVAAGSFNTLAKALGAADLVNALKSEGPFTVFAPTDEAFAKLPPKTLASLLEPGNKAALVSILKYHVVSGRVPAAQARELSHAPTLNGQRIDLKDGDEALSIDGATVIKADIECANGIIHVIDEVILPSLDDVVATAVQAGSFETLVTAVKTAGLVGALKADGPITVFAPSDAAFAKLPKGTVESLLRPENRDKLTAILKHHVVPGRIYAADAIGAGNASTLQGSRLRFRIEDGAMSVNGVRLSKTDLETANGVIHVVDSVLLP